MEINKSNKCTDTQTATIYKESQSMMSKNVRPIKTWKNTEHISFIPNTKYITGRYDDSVEDDTSVDVVYWHYIQLSVKGLYTLAYW